MKCDLIQAVSVVNRGSNDLVQRVFNSVWKGSLGNNNECVHTFCSVYMPPSYYNINYPSSYMKTDNRNSYYCINYCNYCFSNSKYDHNDTLGDIFYRYCNNNICKRYP